jgi:pSer/pThr/pTyr-binding forkhead associated (FHA) protein
MNEIYHLLPLQKLQQGAVWVLLTCLILAFGFPVYAQTGEGYISISEPDASQFPLVSFFLEAYDRQGIFIANIQMDEISILEGSTITQPTGIELIQPGLQVVVAVNPGPMLQNHYAGISNFEHIQADLQNWAVNQSFDTPDNFSLATRDGAYSAHLTIPNEWARSIEEYQLDDETLQPDVNSLSFALDLATDPTSHPYSKQVILYITPTLTEDLLPTHTSLLEQAHEAGVVVFVWLVGSPAAATSQTAEILTNLARITGGDFFLLTGSEELPNLEEYFQPLRYVYQVNYRSTIQESGVHTVSAQVKRADDFEFSSEPRDINVQILPPNPIFLSPPTEIIRSWNTSGPTEKAVLVPNNILIDTMVEFPDGIDRSIRAIRLYVDGALVAENTEAPYNLFIWPLEDYTESATRMIQIEVEDAFNFTNTSIETPVNIFIEAQPEGWISTERIFIATAIFGAAVVFAVILFMAGKRFSPRMQLKKLRSVRDPLTQPVPGSGEILISRPIYPAPLPSLEPVIEPVSAAPARLIKLADDGQPISGGSIAFNKTEITLGSDPQKAIRVLDSNSVSPLHARLYHTGNSEFFIADAGSIAGTWVNYAPVSSQGARLVNGDLIHIGRIAFRFELTDSPRPRQPTVTQYTGE